MQLSIIGAAGAVGQSLATHLLRGGVLTGSDRLQLVGHGVEGTERRLLAERCDSFDAFDEVAPPIEVVALSSAVVGAQVRLAGTGENVPDGRRAPW
jgi:nucleoside-diphosphate-sugar epimerase